MERRDLLRLGLLAGAGAGAGTLGGTAGCALPRVVRDSRGMPADMDAYLARVDQNLAHMASYRMLDDFVPEARRPTEPAAACQYEADNLLMRRSLRTLFMTGCFHDLPEEAQLHPGMQRRMYEQLPEADAAVFGMSDMLASRTTAQRAEVRRRLRAEPGLPNKIGEVLDDRASDVELTGRRRVQLRALLAQTSWRMKHMDPGLLMDEYVGKVQRVTERAGSQAEQQRRLIKQIGEDAFWRYQQRLAAGNTGIILAQAADPLPAEPAPDQEPQIPPPPEPEQQPDREVPPNVPPRPQQVAPPRAAAPPPAVAGCSDAEINRLAGQKVSSTGGYMMGYGLLTFALSGLLIGTAGDGSDGAVILGLFGLTLGAGLLLGGLVVYIVGNGMS